MHILLHSEVAMGVWSNVMRWWNISLLIPPNLFIHWACWNGVESRKRLKKGLGLCLAHDELGVVECEE